MNIRSTLLLSTIITSASLAAYAADKADTSNRYSQTNFVANKASYKPTLNVEPEMVDAWGIAIRPVGAGGHFWVLAKDHSYEYVGDVQNSSDEKLRKLYQEDALKSIKLPIGGPDNFATGVVFNNSTKDFSITQKVEGVEPITAPAKFMFASDGGIISAWTERKKTDGTFDRAHESLSVIDQSKEGAQFFGLAISSANDRLYAADFGAAPSIKVFDGKFQPSTIKFDMPFDTNNNGKVDPGEYAPFGIHALKTPGGANHIFVTYAKTQVCPEEEIKKGTCKKDELFVGEEDTAKPGQGRLAEFDEDGKLVSIWQDSGKLSAPWGAAYAPASFGALGGSLLIGNFGDGTIAAFDARTHTFKDVVRDESGKPVKIEKVWEILFGNGESLGDADSLYFAAGPEDEKAGLFGRLRPVPAKK